MTKEERAKINKQNAKNAGRKPGSKNQMTLVKEEIQKELENRVLHLAHALLDREIELAMGGRVVFKQELKKKRDKEGEWKIVKSAPVRVTDPEEIRQAIIAESQPAKSDGKVQYFTFETKEPSLAAIESIKNRYFGRPVQAIEVTNKDPEYDETTKRKSRTALNQALRRDTGQGGKA